MPTSRTFNVVWVGPNHGSGVDVTAEPDQVVKYDDSEVTVNARQRRLAAVSARIDACSCSDLEALGYRWMPEAVRYLCVRTSRFIVPSAL